MKLKLVHFLLVLGIGLSSNLAYGQDSLPAVAKKARTFEDYEASTLKEIVAMDSDVQNRRDGKTSGHKRDAILPFRVRVIYTASRRPTSTTSKDTLQRWAQCCAGNPDHYTKDYDVERQFNENGRSYWLAIQKSLIPILEKELNPGEFVDLFLIRLNTPGSDGNTGSVLLVERYKRVQAVNGRSLKREAIFHFDPVQGADIKKPSAGIRFKYIGYETGGFSGLPERAFDFIPRVQTEGYSFTTSFVILRDDKSSK